MHTLPDVATAIIEQDRHAGHSWPTILMALELTREHDVNRAARRLRDLKDRGAPPRWLVQRWAQDARLGRSR